MAFKLGEVLSPTVAAALARRGEASGPYAEGGRIIRKDPSRRVVGGGEGLDPMALLREQRLMKAQEREEAAQRRAEDMAREQIDYRKERDKKSDEAAEASGAMAGEEFKLKQSAEQRQVIAESRAIIKTMTDIMANARKPDPNTGQTNPRQMQEAEQAVKQLWARFKALGLSPEAEKAALAEIGGAKTTPPQRMPPEAAAPAAAPGNPFSEAYEGVQESLGARMGRHASAVGGSKKRPKGISDQAIADIINPPRIP